MSLLDIPTPPQRIGRKVEPLGKWPTDPTPEKREAQRLNAIAGAAKRRESKEAA